MLLKLRVEMDHLDHQNEWISAWIVGEVCSLFSNAYPVMSLLEAK